MATSYDLIAGEYYNQIHITSRNFDTTTLDGLKAHNIVLPETGLILEAGCGKGRSIEYFGVDPQRVIHLDSSKVMLSLPDREPCLLKILCSADQLPFIDNYFTCVTGFLCDPFWGNEFLKEVYRILQPGGTFIATLPSYSWGIPLRDQLGFKKEITKFKTQNGDYIEVPSVLVPNDQVYSTLESVGFAADKTKIYPLKLSKEISKISPHISMSAETQQVSLKELSIVDLILVTKDS